MLIRKFSIVGTLVLLLLLASLTPTSGVPAAAGGRTAGLVDGGAEEGLADPEMEDLLLGGEMDERYWEALEREMEESNKNGSVTEESSRAIDITTATIYFIVSIVGITANFVVFFVIIAGKEISKTVTAMYVLQLTITDSLFLSMLPLFAFYRLTNVWTFGAGLCRFSRSLQTLNYNASIFFLTAMSVDRYIAVAYNTRSQQLRTKRRTAIVCVIVWIVAFFMTLPTLLYSTTIERDGTTFCNTKFPDEFVEDELSLIYYSDYYDGDNYDSAQMGNTAIPVVGEMEATEAPGSVDLDYTEYTTDAASAMADLLDNQTSSDGSDGLRDMQLGKSCLDHTTGSIERTWIYVQFVTAFLIPFSIITISYVFIVRKLRLSENKIANSVGQRTARVRKRVTRMVAILVVCFVICWFPYHITEMVQLQGGVVMNYNACSAMKQVFTALAYANSAVNPLLYTFLGHNFMDRFNESIRNTRRFFLPGILRRKIKMSSSLDCKRPSVSGKYRKSATVKTDDAREGEEIMMKNMGKRKGDSNNSSNDSPKNHKKRPTRVLLPCETEMTPVDDGKNYDDAFSAL